MLELLALVRTYLLGLLVQPAQAPAWQWGRIKIKDVPVHHWGRFAWVDNRQRCLVEALRLDDGINAWTYDASQLLALRHGTEEEVRREFLECHAIRTDPAAQIRESELVEYPEDWGCTDCNSCGESSCPTCVHYDSAIPPPPPLSDDLEEQLRKTIDMVQAAKTIPAHAWNAVRTARSEVP
jgi:hypothetical protein